MFSMVLTSQCGHLSEIGYWAGWTFHLDVPIIADHCRSVPKFFHVIWCPKGGFQWCFTKSDHTGHKHSQTLVYCASPTGDFLDELTGRRWDLTCSFLDVCSSPLLQLSQVLMPVFSQPDQEDVGFIFSKLVIYLNKFPQLFHVNH